MVTVQQGGQARAYHRMLLTTIAGSEVPANGEAWGSDSCWVPSINPPIPQRREPEAVQPLVPPPRGEENALASGLGAKVLPLEPSSRSNPSEIRPKVHKLTPEQLRTMQIALLKICEVFSLRFSNCTRQGEKRKNLSQSFTKFVPWCKIQFLDVVLVDDIIHDIVALCFEELLCPHHLQHCMVHSH